MNRFDSIAGIENIEEKLETTEDISERIEKIKNNLKSAKEKLIAIIKPMTKLLITIRKTIQVEVSENLNLILGSDGCYYKHKDSAASLGNFQTVVESDYYVDTFFATIEVLPKIQNAFENAVGPVEDKLRRFNESI